MEIKNVIITEVIHDSQSYVITLEDPEYSEIDLHVTTIQGTVCSYSVNCVSLVRFTTKQVQMLVQEAEEFLKKLPAKVHTNAKCEELILNLIDFLELEKVKGKYRIVMPESKYKKNALMAVVRDISTLGLKTVTQIINKS